MCILLLIEGFFHLFNGVPFGGFGNVDVGLHGLVVEVAGVGADEFVLGIDFIVAGTVAVRNQVLIRVHASEPV